MILETQEHTDPKDSDLAPDQELYRYQYAHTILYTLF
jgi:hypothetical protein